MPQKEDLTNQRFGRLLVISRAEAIKGRTAWSCQCDCGNMANIISKYLKNGDTKSCGCLNTDKRKEKAQLMMAAWTKFEPRIAAARNMWRASYNEMQFDDFYRLSQLPCFYCDSEPSNKADLTKLTERSVFAKENGTFIYNGLDRVDPSLGHTVENCVPSCWICNRTKRDQSLNSFYQQINRLINNIDKTSPQEYRDKCIITQIDQKIIGLINVKYLYGYNDGDLSVEQFFSLSRMNCYYCNSEPSNIVTNYNKKKIYLHSGLDRISCDLPHNYDNVVPCCKYCNYGKRDMTLDDFNKWIDKLTKKNAGNDPAFFNQQKPD